MQIQLREKTMTLKKYGVEIEMWNIANIHRLAADLSSSGILTRVEGYNHTTRSHWKIVSDVSIRRAGSCELVSPVLEGEAGLNQIKTVCEVLDRHNAKVAITCGLHVHHDARDLDAEKIKKVVKIYKRIEKRVDEFMPKSRRAGRNRYCGTVLDAPVDVVAARRYVKVNLTAFQRHGTVEFRHHSGTVDAAKIINWVLFTALVMDKARGRVSSTKELKRWVDVKWFLGVTTDRISGVMKDMVEFYTARRRALAG